MRKRLWLLAAFPLALALPAFGQERVSAGIEGRHVAFMLPEGYCEARRSTAYGSAAYAVLEKLNERRNRVLLLFANCRELELKARDPAYRIHQHGSYLAPMNDGKLTVVPPGYTRAKLLEEMRDVLPKLSSGEVGDLAQQQIRDAELDRQLQLSGTVVSYLAEDAAAVYAGISSLVAMEGTKVRISCVTAITLVEDYIVSINLYDDFDPQASFSVLLAAQKGVAKALIAANP
jgi:hypothetical protein